MTTIEGGFKPVPNDDVPELLAYGNETTTVLESGVFKCVVAGYCAGWMGRRVVVSRGVQVGAQAGRQLVAIDVDTLHETDLTIDPLQNAGWWPQVAMKGGHWVSSVVGQHYLDGVAIPTEPGAQLIEDWDGTHILYPVQDTNGIYTFVVRDIWAREDVSRVTCAPWTKLENARLDLLSDGSWLSWTATGGMGVKAPSGAEWVRGEGRGLLFERAGQRYVATYTAEGWTPVWVVRTWESWLANGPGWTLRGIGGQGMAYWSGNVAGYVQADGGRLSIAQLDFDAPAAAYSPPAIPTATFPEPTYPATQRPVVRSCLTWDQTAPGNAGGSRNSPDRLIVEGVGEDATNGVYILPEHEARLVAIFTSYHETPTANWPFDYPQHVAMAKRTSACVLVYADRATWDLQWLVDQYKADGVAAIPCIRCYPSNKADTSDAIIQRLRDALAVTSGPIGIVRPVYAQNVWDEVEVAKLNIALAALVEIEPRIVFDIAFGWKRPQGSTALLAWVWGFFAELCARTPSVSRESLPRTLTSVVTPPVVEPIAPIQPPLVVPKQTWWQKLFGIQPKPKRSRRDEMLERLRRRRDG